MISDTEINWMKWSMDEWFTFWTVPNKKNSASRWKALQSTLQTGYNPKNTEHIL